LGHCLKDISNALKLKMIGNRYLLELCRYIHRNPVDDQIVERIEDWEFSNYLEWVGKRNGNLIDTDLRDRYFPDGKEYEKYVMNYLSDKQVRNELRNYLLELKSYKNNKRKVTK